MADGYALKMQLYESSVGLANSLSPEKLDMSIRLLRLEMERTKAMGIEVLVAHIPQQTNYSINALIY